MGEVYNRFTPNKIKCQKEKKSIYITNPNAFRPDIPITKTINKLSGMMCFQSIAIDRAILVSSFG